MPRTFPTTLALALALGHGACGGQAHDGAATGGGGAEEPSTGGNESSGGSGGSGGGGIAGMAGSGAVDSGSGGTGEPGAGGTGEPGAGGTGEPGSGGAGPALPENCVPLELQADGTYVAEVTIDREDPLEFFTNWGSHTERVCGYFENHDRIRVTATAGSPPSLINFVLQGQGDPVFSDEQDVQLEQLVGSAALALRAPVLAQFLIGGIRGALDVGKVRVTVDVLERFCTPAASATVYGRDGYRDDRDADGFFGHYFAEASPGADLCSPPLSGESACVAGRVEGDDYLAVVTHLAQERDGTPMLWTPGEEFVGVAYDRSKGVRVGLTDGETTWWDRRSSATPWNEAHWADFQSDDGTVYNREPLLSLIQVPSQPSSSDRVSFCARPVAPVLAAGSRPDCQWLSPGTNRITIFGANQAAGLMCFHADQPQILHMEIWGGPEIFYFDHMGPNSSYFGPILKSYRGMFTEWQMRHSFDIEIPQGPNGFVIGDFRQQLDDDAEVLLDLSVTTP